MVKVRQDAWSHEDDLLLAETVLRHIREGSTQLNAFEEVGDKLNRTSAACGFRWNAEVRQRYEQAVSIAKRQRKEKKRALARQQQSTTRQEVIPATHTETEQFSIPSQEIELDAEPLPKRSELDFSTLPSSDFESNEMNIDNIIDYLRDIKKDVNNSTLSKSGMERLQRENEELKQENQLMEKKIGQLEKQLHTVQEDYQVLIQIMDRARKMVVFDDDETVPTPAFRMEKNGNLEQVAR
ncbi:RsfA family transcriptional regulator [Aquibacillus kalidii]|uniref:RsfA family transcriptional regulator n=1 Tax=Aquibacillus kalidii TaxID=2762597 RepID=UPI00164952FD